MVGTGFVLIHGTARFIDFSLSALLSIGAYVALTVHLVLGLPVWAAVCIGAAGAGFVSLLIDRSIYQPLRRGRATPLVFLLTSLGVGLILQNAVSMVWGDDARSMPNSFGSTVLPVLGARISSVRLVILAVSIVTVLGVAVFMSRTKMGTLLRCIGSSRILAETVGIRTDRGFTFAAVLAATIVGLAGALMSLDVGLTPTMGVAPFIMGAVAVLVAGTGNIILIAGVAILMALIQQVTIWFLGSQWSDLVTLVVLIVVLIGRSGQGARKDYGSRLV